jgi:type II secretory pathway pseudopilin PulG
MTKSKYPTTGKGPELIGSGFGDSDFIGHWSLVIGHSKRAFSLLEMIGILAVLAILATVLAPSFVRTMDKSASDQESATLKSFGDALQQSILRKRYIPSEVDWATNIAAEFGADVTYVTTSPRNQPRYFLIDPALQVGVNGGGLPYTQTSVGSAVTNNSGTIIPPISPRVIIISSIGRALPAGFVSGVALPANFTNIWNAPDGTVPPAPIFSGWPGSGDELRVQRIDLSPVFVQLQLTKSVTSRCCPRYSIDGNDWGTAIAVTDTRPDWPGYFIQNSMLYLYKHGSQLDSLQILIRNNTFIYDQNTWRGSIGGEGFAGGLDIASMVDRYLAAYPNVNAQNGTNQQAVVVKSMMDFMDRYDEWAAAGFPAPSSSYSAVQQAQVDMRNAVQGQYIQAGGYNPNQVNCQ